MAFSVCFRILNTGEENTHLIICVTCFLKSCFLQWLFLIWNVLIQEQDMSWTFLSGRMIVQFMNVLSIYGIPIGSILWFNPRSGWSGICLLLLKANTLLCAASAIRWFSKGVPHHQKKEFILLIKYFLLAQKNASTKKQGVVALYVKLRCHTTALSFGLVSSF